MKRTVLTVIFFLSSLAAAFANDIDTKCPQHVIFGAPVSAIPDNQAQYLCRLGYAVRYRYQTKTPEYVVEHLTVAKVTGTFKRQDDFRPDPEVPPAARATLQDYAGQPYDRGHVSPAGNNTESAAAMSQSFFLTNMVPQVPNNNRGIWKQIETLVRDWTVRNGDIFVISGSIYNPQYKVIGNGLGVPDGLFKIVVDPKHQRVIAFMLPNAPAGANDYPKYVVPVTEVERVTGIRFFPGLPPAAQAIKSQPGNLAEWMK